MPTDTIAQHLLAEYRGCDVDVLGDLERVQVLLRRAALAAGATVVAETFHEFTPQGVTGVVVLEESHLSIHTWPEAGYAAVDFFTCGDCKPERAHRLIAHELGAATSEVMSVRRGDHPPRRSMAVESHEVESHEVGPEVGHEVGHEVGPGAGDLDTGA